MTVKNESAEIALAKSGLNGDDIKAKIYAAYYAANEVQIADGMEWYSDTQNLVRHMSDVTGFSTAVCGAVISHCSVRAQWTQNVSAAWAILLGEIDLAKPYVLGGNIERSVKAIVSDNPIDTFNGHKTRNFARNIAGDMNGVTIDVWMCKAIAIEQKWLTRVGLYEALADIFREVANEVNISAAQLQAIVWVVTKGNKGY